MSATLHKKFQIITEKSSGRLAEKLYLNLIKAGVVGVDLVQLD